MTEPQDIVVEARALIAGRRLRSTSTEQHIFADDAEDFLRQLCDEVEKLREAVTTTLDENKHLADGDNCTLIHLKRAMDTMTNPSILDGEAIKEIEVRLNAHKKRMTADPNPYDDGWNQKDYEESVAFSVHAIRDIDALCQTVRALRAENKRLVHEITSINDAAVERDAR